jgi:hypothetical protein
MGVTPISWASTIETHGTLEMLSLMGQALRFERPSTPALFTVEPEIKDERKIIANGLRRPLIRLLTSKNATEHPARALARTFDRLRLRPLQRWADRQKSEAETRSYFDPELLNESNWTQPTLSRRTAYLEQRRREDADAARALVESTWAQEEADARFRLLQVFQTRLSMSDQTFLNTLEMDRAPRVRALAARFLARLGAGSENPVAADGTPISANIRWQSPA